MNLQKIFLTMAVIATLLAITMLDTSAVYALCTVDGYCDEANNEKLVNCAADCYCGNGQCESYESLLSCCQDCGTVGDGVCCPADGEDDPSDPNYSNADCGPLCDDSICEYPASESPDTCPQDCSDQVACGDSVGACDPWETVVNCPADCLCGNSVCDPGEDIDTCCLDCGWCGDGKCCLYEDYENCPADCSGSTAIPGGTADDGTSKVNYMPYTRLSLEGKGADPNVLLFIDSAGSMNAQVNSDAKKRKRYEIILDVLAGYGDHLQYTGGAYTDEPLYQPHFQYSSPGETWVVDDLMDLALGDTADPLGSGLIPVYRVRLFSGDTAAADEYEPAPTTTLVGKHFVFYGPDDATIVAAGDSASIQIEQSLTTFDEYMRWMSNYTYIAGGKYNIRKIEDQAIVFEDGSTTTRDIWINDNFNYLYTFEEATSAFYKYKVTGAEELIDGIAGKNYLVPVKHEAKANTRWTDPSKQTIPRRNKYTAVGLCYTYPESTGVGWGWTSCYKPSSINDIDSNTTFYFVLFYDLNEFKRDNAQEVTNNKILLEQMKIDYKNEYLVTPDYYCPVEQKEIWGDAPYSDWRFRNNAPLTDGNTASVQVYRVCDELDAGYQDLKFPWPATGSTTLKVITDKMTGAIPKVVEVDDNRVDKPGEFIKPSGASLSIVKHLRDELEAYPYNPAKTFYWPGADNSTILISLLDPWFGGLFKYLYYDRVFDGEQGIMQQFPNINYGVAGIDNDNPCTGDDFPPDNDGKCYGANLIYNPTSWGEFTAYREEGYNKFKLNDTVREYLKPASFKGGGNAPISSSLHDIWRWFYNQEMDLDQLDGSTGWRVQDPPSLWDVVYTADGGIVEGKRAPAGSMFFNLTWPDWAPNAPNDDHIIQCDPAYMYGCRRNYMIYFTGGKQLSSEQATTGYNPYSGIDICEEMTGGTDSVPITTSVDYGDLKGSEKDIVAMMEWVKALKDPTYYPGYINPGYSAPRTICDSSDVAEREGDSIKPYGLKTFVVGFGADANSGEAQTLCAMARSSEMGTGDDDDFINPLIAWNEDSLRKRLAKVFSAIMAGTYAKASPEIDRRNSVIGATIVLTTYFKVSAETLWKGHLQAWSVPDDELLESTMLWDVGDILTGTSISLYKDTPTPADSDRNMFTSDPSGSVGNIIEMDTGKASYLHDLFDPEVSGTVKWGTDSSVRTDKAVELINFLRGKTVDDPENPIAKWKLGAIYHSKPRIIYAPSSASLGALEGYNDFRDANSDRDPFVYLGTLYGGLQAFSLEGDTSTGGSIVAGEELFMYYPPGVMRYLKEMSKGLSVYGVDSTPMINDMYYYGPDPIGGTFTGEEWRTVLVSGLGGGGTSYFAADITGVSHSDTAPGLIPMWNFNDDRLAFTWSVPVTVRTYDPHLDGSSDEIFDRGRWASFFGGGLQNKPGNPDNADVGGYFFVLDATLGDAITVIELPDNRQYTDDPIDFDIDNLNSEPNYNMVPGSPILLDKNGDGFYDRAYVGDYRGQIWKIYQDPADYKWKQCLFFDTRDLDGNGVLEGSENDESLRRPSWYTPALAIGGNNADFLVVYFTTGIDEQDFAEAAEEFANTKHQNYLFGVVDLDGTTACTYADPIIGNALDITDEEATELEIPWPAFAFEENEVPLTTVYVVDGRLWFKTHAHNVTETQDPCDPGEVRLWALDYLTLEPTYFDEDDQGNPQQYTTGHSHSGLVIDPEGNVWDNKPGDPPEMNPGEGNPARPMSWGEGITW